MEITKATAGFLAATCVLVGAGGAYLASRSDAPAAQAQEVSRVSPDPAATAVEQSEGLVAEAPESSASPVAGPLSGAASGGSASGGTAPRPAAPRATPAPAPAARVARTEPAPQPRAPEPAAA